MVKTAAALPSESTTDNPIQRYQFPAVSRGQAEEQATPVSHYPLLRATVRKVRERDRRLHRAAQEANYAESQQRGYEDGFAAGYQAAQQEVQQHHQHSARQWLGLINSLWHELSNLHQATLLNLGQPLVALISKVVQQVVNHELVTSPESLQQLVSDALTLLPETQSVVLEINPLDRSLLEPVIEKLPAGWSVREDDTLTSGGCRLISEHGKVDATVESRLASCIDAVHEQLVPHD